jgi:LppP/LprE lipoprotein
MARVNGRASPAAEQAGIRAAFPAPAAGSAARLLSAAEQVGIRAAAKYSGAMIRRDKRGGRGAPRGQIGRAARVAAVLALGATGGSLLGGCGGGTKTVTVTAAPAPSANTGAARAKGAGTTGKGGAAGGADSTSTTGGGGEGGQSASTTRTAPAPAFTHTGGEAAPGAGAAAAEAVVRAHGYAPADVAAYRPDQTLRVLLGTRPGAVGEHEQHAFFFLDGHYLGTDASAASGSIRVVGQSDTEVALAYALYRPHDSLCCPSGGETTVHFQLNNGKLVPLGAIPPASSSNGLARQ